MYQNDMFMTDSISSLPQQSPPQNPYGYNMTQQWATPMGINSSNIPSLRPTTLTPNLSEQTFMPSDMGGKPGYARGGPVRRYVRGGRALRYAGGGGVPGYAGGGGIGEYFNSLKMPSINQLVGFGAPIVGGMLGGPMGAMAGGAFGGLINGGRPEDMFKGAALAGMPYGGQALGGALGAGLGGGLAGYLGGGGAPGAALGGAGSYLMSPFAKGGSVEPRSRLQHVAEYLREQGTDGDTILAHINPIEAAQLAEQSGGASINPHTGLPSYKFRIGKVLKTVAKVAAPFVGGALAGPAGAAIGGGLAGGLSGSKPKVKNVLIGAGLGFAASGGLGPLGGVGKIIPSVNKAVGLNTLFGSPGKAAATKAGASVGAKAAAAKGAGAAAGAGAAKSGGLGGLMPSGDTLNNLLLGGALLGTLAGRKKAPKEPSFEEVLSKSGINKSGAKDRPVKPTKRVQKILTQEQLDQRGNPEMQYFEDTNPGVQYMADGGYLDGDDSGEADTIPARLSHGEYVVRADVVSGLGDGNNRAGAKKLDSLQDNVLRHKSKNRAKKAPLKAKSLQHYMKTRRTA